MVRRCWNENMSQRGWAPRPPVEQLKRTRTTHGDVRSGWGGQYVAVFVQFPTPSHTHNPFKLSESYIFLKKSSLVFIIASICILQAYVYVLGVCIVNHGHGYTTHIRIFIYKHIHMNILYIYIYIYIYIYKSARTYICSA